MQVVLYDGCKTVVVVVVIVVVVVFFVLHANYKTVIRDKTRDSLHMD